MRAEVKGAPAARAARGWRDWGCRPARPGTPPPPRPHPPGGPRSLPQVTRLPARGSGPVTDPPWVSASPQAPTTRGGAEGGERRTTAAGGPWPREGGPRRRLSRQPLEHRAAAACPPALSRPDTGANTDHSAAVRRHFRSGLQARCRRPAVPTSSAPWRAYRARLRVGSGPSGPRKPRFPARGAATPRPQPCGSIKKKTTSPRIPGDALCACAAELAPSRTRSPRQAEGRFRNCDRPVTPRRKWSARGDQSDCGTAPAGAGGWVRSPRRPSCPLPFLLPWTGREGVRPRRRRRIPQLGHRGRPAPAPWRGCLLSPPVRRPAPCRGGVPFLFKANSQTDPVEREIRNFSFGPKPKRASGEDWVWPRRLLLRVGAPRAPRPLLAQAWAGRTGRGAGEEKGAVPVGGSTSESSHLRPQPH